VKLDSVAKLIGQRIREIRERRGLTQEEFNDGVGPINERSLRRIESGELVNTELMTLLRICRRLKIHPRELFAVDIPWQIEAIPEEIAKKKRKRRP
jgi:transcriptional regulator with XRE-family HTH domain